MNMCLRSMGIAFALLVSLAAPLARAADHRDGPWIIGSPPGADIADVYFFLDPNDNSQLVVIGVVSGFIVPGEAISSAFFDPKHRYRFNFETTGDAVEDKTIDITFSKKTTPTTAQTATIRFSSPRQTFTAPATNSTVDTTAPRQVVTTLPNGVQFFAGETDDAFFFDIPAELRWVDSILAGQRDDSHLTRSRDTFAGYNTITIALRVPVSLLGTSSNGVIGLNFSTEKATEPFQQVDRMAVPAINALFVPFERKDEYNAAKPSDDANGKFAADIAATLKALGTNDANVAVLTRMAVTNGDWLRLDVNIPNTGVQGGTNSAAAFPNGRRLADDVMDTIITIINNGSFLGDNVNANDLAFQNKFPFLAFSQQPRLPGTVDDKTRN